MEQRTITDNQRDILSFKIAEIVLSLSQDENVQCIYFETLYDSTQKDKTNMILHILCKNSDEFAYQSNVDDYNTLNDEGKLFEDFGLRVNINIKGASFEYYHELLELYKSSILFDRTGEFEKLKNQIIKNKEYCLNGESFFNQVVIQPPLESSINDGMQTLKKIMETDSSEKKQF